MSNKIFVLDLVDEMQWEDIVEFDSLEEVGLEEENETDNSFKHGILSYLNWFYDGESSEYNE